MTARATSGCGAKDMGDAFAQSELFGDPVPVADDAPTLHKLLGFTGRNPA